MATTLESHARSKRPENPAIPHVPQAHASGPGTSTSYTTAVCLVYSVYLVYSVCLVGENEVPYPVLGERGPGPAAPGLTRDGKGATRVGDNVTVT